MTPRTAVEAALTRGMARGQMPLLRIIAVCLAVGLLLVPRWGFGAFALACMPSLVLALLATFQRVVIVAELADIWDELVPRSANDAPSPRELDALAAVVAALPKLGVYPLHLGDLRAHLVAALPEDGPCLTGHRPLCAHTVPRQRVSPERADLPSVPAAPSQRRHP